MYSRRELVKGLKRFFSNDEESTTYVTPHHKGDKAMDYKFYYRVGDILEVRHYEMGVFSTLYEKYYWDGENWECLENHSPTS